MLQLAISENDQNEDEEKAPQNPDSCCQDSTSELKWWSFWKSIDGPGVQLAVQNISGTFEVLKRYKITKINDFSGCDNKNSPTIGAWSKILAGSTSHETFLVKLQEGNSWIAFSGNKCLDAKLADTPVAIKKAPHRLKHILEIYKVSEMSEPTFENGFREGYERGYESGRSDGAAAAKSALRNKIWKDAFDAGVQSVYQLKNRNQILKDRFFHYNIYSACLLFGAMLIAI